MSQFGQVGEFLRAARRRLGLSQEQFASALGIKLSRLQKWESGVNVPRLTIPELQRLRGTNQEVFEAIISGFLLLPPPSLHDLLGPKSEAVPHRAIGPGSKASENKKNNFDTNSESPK